jgi:THO complex subunit 1
MKFIISISDENIIDYSNFLVIVEDILDTCPIQDVENIFNLLEMNLKSKPKVLILLTQGTLNESRKLLLLKIINSILKRLSTSMNTQFRGKIQMAIASVFPISDKSAVNIKGLYNLNTNISIDSKEESDKLLLNQKFYKQFWIIIKYLSNPTLVIEFIT